MTRNSNGRVFSIVIALVVICDVRAAEAAPLAVGGSLVPAAEGLVTVDADALTATGPVSFLALGFSGTLTSQVYSNDGMNPFGMDKLTFVYMLRSNSESIHALHRFTISSFANSMTDVSYSPTLTGISPGLIDRSTADVIGFSFLGSIGSGLVGPGASSTWLVVRTDATAFAPTSASVIDGSVATVASFAPLTAIPEPNTLILTAIGAMGLISLVRRRRHK